MVWDGCFQKTRFQTSSFYRTPLLGSTNITQVPWTVRHIGLMPRCCYWQDAPSPNGWLQCDKSKSRKCLDHLRPWLRWLRQFWKAADFQGSFKGVKYIDFLDFFRKIWEKARGGVLCVFACGPRPHFACADASMAATWRPFAATKEMLPKWLRERRGEEEFSDLPIFEVRLKGVTGGWS